MVLDRQGLGVLCALALALFTPSAHAGKLKEFATKATAASPAPESPPQKVRTYGNAESSAFGSGTYPSEGGGESFLGSFFAWLVTAPFQYQYDDPAGGSLTDDGEGRAAGRHTLFPPHEVGEATVPYVRFDYNRQYVDSNIEADDFRLEAGYKAVAIHVRSSRFTDESDGYKLDINQYYGVVRYGGYRSDFVPGTFEVGVGLGVSEFRDNENLANDSGAAFTLPLKYYPVDWGGIEFRPAWYKLVEKVIGDYDLSASLGSRFIQLRGGYRWMWIQGEGKYNNGPYAGFSLSF